MERGHVSLNVSKWIKLYPCKEEQMGLMLKALFTSSTYIS